MMYDGLVIAMISPVLGDISEKDDVVSIGGDSTRAYVRPFRRGRQCRMRKLSISGFDGAQQANRNQHDERRARHMARALSQGAAVPLADGRFVDDRPAGCSAKRFIQVADGCGGNLKDRVLAANKAGDREATNNCSRQDSSWGSAEQWALIWRPIPDAKFNLSAIGGMFDGSMGSELLEPPWYGAAEGESVVGPEKGRHAVSNVRPASFHAIVTFPSID